MSYISPQELDDTVRLVLMDMGQHEGFIVFSKRVREELGNVSAIDLQFYYRKYRGFDRLGATHDLETGKPLH